MNMDLFPVPPKYILQSELPSGFLGLSAVLHLADSDDLFLCKSIEKSHIGSPEKIEKFKDRIYQINALKNKCILGYNEVIETSDRLLLIRPFLNEPPISESLNELTMANDPGIIYDYWKNICVCFNEMHKFHIFPNFIKPNNIFIYQGKITLTDLCPPPSDMDLMLHSPNVFDIGFLAPEFFDNGKIELQADYWSLGVLLTFMLTKALPWTTKNLFSMLQQINTGYLKFTTSIPKHMEEVIRSLVDIDASKRSLPKIVKNSDHNFQQKVDTNSTMHRIASGRMLNVGFLVLQDMSKTGNMVNPICSTNRILPKNGKVPTVGATSAALPGSDTAGSFLLRSRPMPNGMTSSEALSSPHALNSPHSCLVGSYVRLPVNKSE
ncbi:CAMK family protein kinase [Tritrichomonas foetus]|uniref:CAMK family protein kinase n=1 Tax=Tritrichomonas foetus TaxID=1144522 RepID=A0A1J4J8S2_9EUKA|nr:CAMK family protein kinase [Tritrichomonas foetus]|eukprot:OHS95586.1 CAMK family protein kinase [Tritrichomonas foetus]